MRPVITPQESARLDAEATEPVSILMERAGLAVAQAGSRMGAGYGSRVIVLAGPGNNGGDGCVAAKYLAQRGAAVAIQSLGEPKSPESAAAALEARNAGVLIGPLGPPAPCDLLIDALFGVGFRGELPAELVPWTQTDAPVLAVDVPSGLDAETGQAAGAAFAADVTVTFHAYKTGHLLGEGPDRSGEIAIADIGLGGERPALLLCEADDAPRPPRERRAHKWSAGSVLIVGGSPGITGAVVLAGRAALAMGAGAVSIACPGDLQRTIAVQSAGLITHGIGKSDNLGGSDILPVLEYGDRFDVIVAGGGLGTDSADFVAGLVRDWGGPLVLDADALTTVGGRDGMAARSQALVVTPHAGEFERMAGEPATHRAAQRFAEDTGAHVLLKGNPTFVASDQTWVVASGGPALATIGTGDVLAGMVGALWARGLDGADAARSAAYWHGVAAADLARTGTVTAEGLAAHVRGVAW